MTPAMLHGMGLPVIPATAHKAPAVRWQQFQDRIPTQAEFDAWTRRQYPVWGIVTGKIAGRVVLDFDGEEGRRTLERLGLKPHVMTPSGGAHVHVAHPGFPVKTENHNSSRRKPWSQEWPGTDIRGDGGFEALIGATEKGSYSIVRDLAELELWNTLPATFRRHFEPRPATSRANFEHELLRRALDLAATSGRNESGLWLAVQLRDNGQNENETEAVMLRYQRGVGSCNRKGEPEAYTVEEVRASIRSAYSRPAREPWGDNGHPVLAMPAQAARSLRSFPFTDTGNAERFAQSCGERFRYSAPERTWYVWTGKRWEADKTGRAMAETKRITRALYREASDIEDRTERADVAGWARKTESLDRRKAMLVLAQCEGEIPITPDQWDVDVWLLNCASGTVDLRTGELRSHRREDLITRMAPIEYVPGARSEAWDWILRDTASDDPEFAAFLQRAVGYSLTGDTREEVLLMPLGPSATGKSTFLEAVRGVMGDYACTADFESFVAKRDAGVRNDIAALAGRRMVVSIEVEEGKRLAEGLVKNLTGRDTISARFLYQEALSFRPQFKLWLAANDAPRVRHADSAIWRRILRLPFEHVVPVERRDPTLKERLCSMPDCQRAVLAWAVEGALRWREEGLMVPERIV